jgi:hypothetical protein
MSKMAGMINRLKRPFLIALAVASFALVAQSARAITLDFEGFGTGQIIDDEYFASDGVTISANNLSAGPDVAIIFDSNNPSGGDTDLGAPFSSGSYYPGNILIIQENHTCDAYFCSDPDDEGSRPAGIFTIEFNAPVLLGSIDFFDIETAEDGETANNRIWLYGGGGLLPVDFWTPDTGGDNTWGTAYFNVADVTRIEIHMGGSGAIDNINFAVPEPSTLLLLGSGLAGLGFMRRRFKA